MPGSIIDRPLNPRPSVESVVAAGTLGLACTGIALLLNFRLMRTLGSTGVTSYRRSGLSVRLGVIVLGETVTSVAFGLAAVIVGVALINLRRG
jgi:drug/metabolite transporter (DMT)-like permease